MKILIDIPDNEYNLIMGSDKTCNANSCSKELMMHAIKNGTAITDGATNGEVLKQIFGIKDEDTKVEAPLFVNLYDFDCQRDNFCSPHQFFRYWWDEQYSQGKTHWWDKKKGVKVKEN